MEALTQPHRSLRTPCYRGAVYRSTGLQVCVCVCVCVCVSCENVFEQGALHQLATRGTLSEVKQLHG